MTRLERAEELLRECERRIRAGWPGDRLAYEIHVFMTSPPDEPQGEPGYVWRVCGRAGIVAEGVTDNYSIAQEWAGVWLPSANARIERAQIGPWEAI